jgi:hypothetical protein
VERIEMTQFQIVYYSLPFVAPPYTATALALLFEKILLPGVYLPERKLDPEALTEQIEELQARRRAGHRDSQDAFMELGLRFFRDYQDLEGVFVGTGKRGFLGTLEPGAEDLTRVFEEAIYGPPPQGFTPTPELGANFPALDDQINTPSWLSYPPNAYLYAQKRGLPLVSDNQVLPVPERLVDPANADLVAAHLAISSVATVLPAIRPFTAQEIMLARDALAVDINSFHAAMSSYVDDVRGLFESSATESDVARDTDYVAKTKVVPALQNLVSRVETPGTIIKDEVSGRWAEGRADARHAVGCTLAPRAASRSRYGLDGPTRIQGIEAPHDCSGAANAQWAQLAAPTSRGVRATLSVIEPSLAPRALRERRGFATSLAGLVRSEGVRGTHRTPSSVGERERCPK